MVNFRLRLPARRSEERGAVAILVAVVAMALFLVAALVVDLGFARDTKRQSQNAADASALAAASALYPATNACTSPSGGTPPCFTDAVNAAKTYATVNFGVGAGEWATCTDSAALTSKPGGTPCISFNAANSTVSQVRVVVPVRNVDTGLGNLAGVSRIRISTMAQASVAPGLPGTPACGLCVLSNTAVSGNPEIQVNNNNIHLNTSSFSGNPTVATNQQFITTQPPSTSGRPTLPPRTAGGVPPDPFAHLAMPFTAAANALPDRGSPSFSGNGTCTLQPGRYGGLSLSGSRACTMQPGLYAFTGSVRFSGSSSLNATSGVTLYFTCGTSSAVRECGATYPFLEYGGSIDLSGTNDVDIVAPKNGSAWDGLAIVYDRNNGSNLDYSGTNQKTLKGSIYAKSATMNLSGTADTTGMDSVVVVKNLNLSGNGTIKLNYTSASNPTFPTTPGGIALSK